ncbi:hypothetical protein [Sporosarcina limicola]|uniref:Uncharacterized protein n=1 Tax=Sporosarcina limicola TaxID=34101 RepID=A0A927MIN8_9BACL|nr:hypothetical protein [Sporosarcina limicola]MBE1555380.1 hypothetical protein [Sporosarcina limicola]
MEAMFKEILHELKNVNGRLDSMDIRMSSLEQGQFEIRKDLAELKGNHLEMKKDLVDSFSIFNNSIEHLAESRTLALNDRIFNAEVEIQKIKRHQQTS